MQIYTVSWNQNFLPGNLLSKQVFYANTKLPQPGWGWLKEQGREHRDPKSQVTHLSVGMSVGGRLRSGHPSDNHEKVSTALATIL